MITAHATWKARNPDGGSCKIRISRVYPEYTQGLLKFADYNTNRTVTEATRLAQKQKDGNMP